jgi:uncharacterized protein (TIGR02266 family)
MPEKKQVLIICRSAAGQMYLGVLLNRIWYSPMLAKSTEEAVDLAKSTSFSLILFDGDAVSEGLGNAIARMHNDPILKTIPLILFLTNDDPQMNERLLAQGCAAILTKPLDLAIVYGVLSRLSGQPRSSPRVSVKMQVDLDGAASEKKLPCTNVSEGGVFLRTVSPLAEGMVVRIGFFLPHDSERIELDAEVVRSLPLDPQMLSEPGMGLRFLSISQDQQTRIRNYVQWSMMGDLEWDAGI